jgi:hypothetical protein
VNWYDLKLPCTLGEALLTLSKEELVELRRITRIKFSTGLRKPEIVAKLTEELPSSINNVFDTFDESRANLLRKVLARGGVLPLGELDLDDDDYDYLSGLGVFVVGRHNNEPCLGVPLELLEAFRQHDGLPYTERVTRNTHWVTIVQGIIYHYGAIMSYQVHQYLSLLLGREYEDYHTIKPPFWLVLPAMQGFRGLYRVDGQFYCDPILDSAAQVLARRPVELGYKLFNLDDLYAAADPLYVDPTVEGELLCDYLVEHYDLPEDKARRLIYVGRRFAMREGNIGAAFAAFAVVCGAGATELDPELKELIVDYLNHTPHWALYGHSLADLVPPPREGMPGKLVSFSEYKNRGK